MAAEKTQQQLQFDKMTKTPIPKLVMGLAVPTILSMLITSIYNLADTFFVGQISTSASGAVGVVSSLMAVIQAIGFMLGHGAGSIISRKLGSGDAPAASRFASTSFFTAVGAGAALGVFGIAGLTPLMRLLGSTETILPHARDYAFYILLAAPFMMSSLVMNNILRYEGKASFAMIGLVTGGVLNMVLDPVFIFGFGMGTGGAGLATGLSQIVSFLILLSMYLRGKTVSKLALRHYTRSGREIAAILTTGLPSFGRQGLASFASMMLNVAARPYGDAAVAAMSIVSRIFQFLMSVALGVGQGFQPVASYNYGAQKFHRGTRWSASSGTTTPSPPSRCRLSAGSASPPCCSRCWSAAICCSRAWARREGPPSSPAAGRASSSSRSSRCCRTSGAWPGCSTASPSPTPSALWWRCPLWRSFWPSWTGWTPGSGPGRAPNETGIRLRKT